MKKMFWGTAMLALMATSCTNEELINDTSIAGGQPFTLSAEHGLASRTALVGNQTVWSEGDQIYVSSADGTVYGILTLKKGQGTDKAEFFGYISGDPSRLAYTIFPAPKSGNVIDLSNYDAGDGQLDAPMIATFDPNNLNSVSFQNETALVSQKITNLNGQKVTLSGAGIGGQLKPMLVDGKWELVKTGAASNTISISGANDGTLLIPIATSVNEAENADVEKENHPLTLTCTISEPDGGTSYSETYTVTVENGSVTTTNVPEIGYEKSEEVESADAILSGGNITLAENVVLTSPLIITGNTTLDLAGYSISNERDLTAAENATSTDALIVVRPGATLTINDSSNGEGSIITENLVCAIKLTDKNDESNANNEVASLIVNGGTIQGKNFGISGNGNPNRDKTSLTINGGVVKSADYTGIFQPQNGSTIITGGTIEGPWAAMEIRSGKLDISGGTFTATGDFVNPTGTGNGVTIQGAALGISQHTTEKAIVVKISGGEFNATKDGAYSLYEVELQNKPTNVTLSIQGGTFSAPVYSENCEKFISACTFTERSVFDYIADKVLLEMDRDVTLEVAAWNPPYYFGTETTNSITIEGNEYTLTFNHNNTDWNYIRCGNDAAKWIISNVNLTNSGHNDGPWNRHDIRFYNQVELTDVNSDKAIALLDDAVLTRVYISDEHPNNSEAYGLWITAEGQTVVLNDCDIVAHSSKTTDRGIAIKDEYVKESIAKVKLEVYDTTFETQRKASVLVTSTAGADIVWGEGNDISKVNADNANAVWIDKARADYAGEVTVSGCKVIVEP